LAALALVVTSCGGDDGGTASPSSSESSGASQEPGAGGTLTIWADTVIGPAVQSASAAFTEETGVQVTVEEIADELQTAFVTAHQAGNAPDLVIGAHDWIGNLVQNGAIDPIQLTEDKIAEFNPLAIEGVTFNGQIYGVPFAVENVVLFRNPDLVPDAPTTFEELVATAQALRDEGKVTELLAMQVGETGDPYHMYPLFTSAGGYLFGTDDTGTYDPSDLGLADPSAAVAMEKIAEQGEAGTGALKRSITAENVLSLYTDGAAPFLLSGPWYITAIEEAGTPYEISPIPGFEGMGPARPFVGVQALYVAASGENKAIAQEFATNFFTKPEVARAMYDANPRAPALTAVYDEVAAEDPNVAKIIEAGADGDILPAIPEMAAIWSPLGIAEAAVVGGEDPATAIAAAAATVEDSIG
jgi:arabinogalactan oligomer/maltooligosaccharide transport system substrate-binding protein